ncbi:MAG TPA: hypothetical protein G4N92_07465 [Anaerolineae bacterium]|nr:hypothetical protein [Anaerolineae bacterium]
MAEFVKGLDVSEENGIIDWDELKNTEAQFAYIRVMTGSTIDKQFSANWQNASRVAMWRGLIHTMMPDEDIQKQVSRFVKRAENDHGDLPPAVDTSRGVGLDHIHHWVNSTRDMLGVKPLIYTSAGIWNGMKDTSNVKRYILGRAQLWIANWQTNGKPETPTMPADWTEWHFWQYGQGWNYFHGNVEALGEYAGLRAKVTTVTILCYFLRGRINPVYVPGQSEVIFQRGQVLKATDAELVHEGSSGITWIQVEVPTCPCCKMWVSNHPSYVRIEEKLG